MSIKLGLLASSQQQGGTFIPPLDLYPGAAAAYSLRKLRTAYTGAAIRVLRTSDNAQLNIGFVNNILDLTTLANFIGASSGTINTWFDQSGNGRDIVQSTIAYQPIIVNSGSIYTTNGKPSIFLLNANLYCKLDFPTAFLNGATNLSMQMVINIDNGNIDNIGLFGPSTAFNVGVEILSLSNFGNRTALRFNGTLRNANSSPAYQLWNDNSQSLTEIYGNTSSTSAFKNNAAVTLTNSSAMPTLNFNGVYDLGSYGGNLGAKNNGYIQEFIIYTSNELSNRNGISSNINSYYTIY